MKYCFTQTILFLIIQASSVRVANGFRAGNDGNQDLMKRAIEDSFLNIAEPKQPSVVDDHAPPLRNEILDTEFPCLYEYWSRPDIHTIGNMGFGGALHAAIAPVATKVSNQSWHLLLRCALLSQQHSHLSLSRCS